VHALKEIDLSVSKDEYIVMACYSGSGKTSLLKLPRVLDKSTREKYSSKVKFRY
jgi:ABC-type lipoprotein export system ATPase subunit